MFVKTGVVLFLLFASTLAWRGCTPSIDVIFAIESSGYIRQQEFEDSKQFALKVITSIPLSGYGLRAGVVSIAQFADTQVICGLTNDTNAFINSITNFPYLTDFTNIAEGVIASKNELLRDGRYETPKIIIVFSQGNQHDTHGPRDPVLEATGAKALGIIIFVVPLQLDGFDPPNSDVLNAMASSPSYKYSYPLVEIQQFIQALSQINCTSTTGATTGATSTSNTTGATTGATSTGATSTGATSGVSSTGATSTGATSTGASSTGATSTGASSTGATTGVTTGVSTGATSGATTGGISCGPAYCPAGDQCCSDGPNVSNPYYCCTQNQVCCKQNCCSPDQTCNDLGPTGQCVWEKL